MILQQTSGNAANIMTAVQLSPFDPTACWLMMYTDGPDPSPPVNASAFSHPLTADFPRVSFGTWVSTELLPDGSWQATTGVLDFHFASNFAATNFTGAAVVDSATVGTVLAWGDFPDLIQILDNLAHVKFVVRLTVTVSGAVVVDIIRVDGPLI